MADDINTVVLVGRLTKAAECKYPREGFAVVNFTIAVNQSKKVNNEWTKYPNYFDVVFTGNYAAAMSKSLSKGLEVTVSGHLHQDRWEKNYQRYSKIIIQADNVKPGKLPKGTNAENSDAPAYAAEPAPTEQPDFSDSQDYGDEIPFN